MKMLNFGCGHRIHTDWTNIDFSPMDNRVKKVNLLGKLPFTDAHFDIAYSSHFLEHVTPNKAQEILLEIKRVLKRGGILRIVVPDLENMIRAYLNALESLKKSLMDSQHTENITGGGRRETLARNLNLIQNPKIKDLEFEYDWMMLEIFDQIVRMNPGGQMQECFSSIQEARDIFKASVVQKRVGEDLLHPCTHTLHIPLYAKFTLDKISNKILNLYLKLLYRLTPKNVRSEVFIQTSIGERHKWLYDSFSLTRLLAQCGFHDINIMNYNTSSIPNFNDYLLDINADSTPYKGVSSLYIEARKSTH